MVPWLRPAVVIPENSGGFRENSGGFRENIVNPFPEGLEVFWDPKMIPGPPEPYRSDVAFDQWPP